MTAQEKAAKKAAEEADRNKKYIGPKYTKGLSLRGKIYRPAEVEQNDIKEYLEQNPEMSKYFK